MTALKFKIEPLRLLLVACIVGTALRLAFGADIEFKSDEAYMLERVLRVGVSESWPWLGISSGVLVKNPGMSVWVFLFLGKLVALITGAPPDAIRLARSVQVLNSLALFVLCCFSYKKMTGDRQRLWMWAIALQAVNPLALLYQRKIWAQSVLPLFCAIFLTSFWARGSKKGAFSWGLIGACLGQIHMSGFFFAAAFALFVALSEFKSIPWRSWLIGSTLGALPLIPWIVDSVTHPSHGHVMFGWTEAIQFKYWVFWFTDPLGLHLGNTLGVKIGNSAWTQLQDFLRYPLVMGQPTCVVGFLHVSLLAWIAWTMIPLLKSRLRLAPLHLTLRRLILNDGGDSTSLALHASLLGTGLLMTLATIVVHRYYLLITYPLEWVWLCGVVFYRFRDLARQNRSLFLLWTIQLCISISFLAYIHQRGGSIDGDYGISYGASLHGR